MQNKLLIFSLLIISVQSFAQSFQDVKIRDLTKKNGFFVLEIKGAIVPPMAEIVGELLEAVADGERVVIALDSPGGINTVGEKIVDSIRSNQERMTIDTFVDNGSVCASMCIPLFVQGKKKVAGARSMFMFHGASTWYTNVPNATMSKRYVDLLIDSGVNAKWLGDLWLRGVFTEPVEYWLSGQELFEKDTRIVTELKPRFLKLKRIEPPFDPSIRPR